MHDSYVVMTMPCKSSFRRLKWYKLNQSQNGSTKFSAHPPYPVWSKLVRWFGSCYMLTDMKKTDIALDILRNAPIKWKRKQYLISLHSDCRFKFRHFGSSLNDSVFKPSELWCWCLGFTRRVKFRVIRVSKEAAAYSFRVMNISDVVHRWWDWWTEN